MTAQYKPYKDQDDFDDQLDGNNWADQDRGSVQIFDRSSPPKSKRTLIAGAMAIALMAVLFGVLIGYFAHSQHSECKRRVSVALYSVMDEDPTIRRKILKEVDGTKIMNTVGKLTRNTRLAGKKESVSSANYIKNKWKRYGLKTEIKDYNVLLNYAKVGASNQVQIISDNGTVAFSADSVTLKGSEHKLEFEMSPIAAYSKSGNVTAELVYAEYCFPSALKVLQKRFKINVAGKILICRQLKDVALQEVVKGAEDAGAVGVLFYIDPHDTDAVTQKSRVPDDAVGMTNARFALQFYGDPLTPGYPALKFTHRMKLDSVAMPKILVQPISSSDARNILGKMGGVKVPMYWSGGFKIEYRLGPGFEDPNLKLKIVVRNEMKRAIIKNVIGTIKGRVEPDRYIIFGAHRDSWRFGAIDNAGGTAIVDEVARVFGKLVKSGWQPRRTIIFASWDANLYGLIGSTEWIEEYFKILRERAIAYVNADSVVVGTEAIVASGSPLLQNAVFNATKEVPNPGVRKKNLKTVYDAWLNYEFRHRDMDTMVFKEYARNRSKDIASGRNVGAGLLTGYLNSVTEQKIPQYTHPAEISDWQPFVQKVGIPIVQLNYYGQSKNHPVHKYETKYDTFNRLKALDPGFKCHEAIAKVYGELIRNLADSLFIPFNLLDYVQDISETFVHHANVKYTTWLHRGIDIALVEKALKNFTNAAFLFHLKQELMQIVNPMGIRELNDQMHLLERTFSEVNYLPKNLLKRALEMAIRNETRSSDENILDTFSPGITGLLATLANDPKVDDDWEVFRIYHSILVYTIQSAASALISF
ncbi:FOLH1 (predicted) [Pycnogonum litorale]